MRCRSKVGHVQVARLGERLVDALPCPRTSAHLHHDHLDVRGVDGGKHLPRLTAPEEVQGEEFGRIDGDSVHAVDGVAEDSQVAFVGDDLLQVGGDDPFAMGHGAISFWY